MTHEIRVALQTDGELKDTYIAVVMAFDKAWHNSGIVTHGDSPEAAFKAALIQHRRKGIKVNGAVSSPVLDIFLEQFGYTDRTINCDTKISSFGGDSLDMVEIIMELENHFDILIEDDAVAKFETMGDIQAYLQSKGI